MDVLFDDLVGQSLCGGRYLIDSYLDKGSYGKVYAVTDMCSEAKGGSDLKPLVVKILPSSKNALAEIRIFRKLQKKIGRRQAKNKETVPGLGKVAELVKWGEFYHVTLDGKYWSGNSQVFTEDNFTPCLYMIMPRYGMNLEKLFLKRKMQFSEEEILSLGLQLVNILEQIHDAGFVFNDLKLDNILLDNGVSESELL